MLDGISVSGVFHSVREDFGTGQTQWTIAVIPKIQATYPNYASALRNPDGRNGAFRAGPILRDRRCVLSGRLDLTVGRRD